VRLAEMSWAGERFREISRNVMKLRAAEKHGEDMIWLLSGSPASVRKNPRFQARAKNPRLIIHSLDYGVVVDYLA
jgi:hypothetical protein